MAVNLMDMVKAAISSSGVADQIGSAVGLDRSKTNSAIDAAIPVLLSGMMKKASTPSGASELSNMFKKQDAEPSILDNLGSLVSGGTSSKLLSMGASLLPWFLGSSQSSIVSVLMKLFGIGDKGALGLLGSLAPIVMGVVGKQAKTAGGFDPGVLTNLLGSQSNLLSSALPNELKGVMGLADVGRQASETVTNTSRTATRPVTHSAPVAAPASNPLGWLLPLLALAALGFLGYTFLSGSKKEETVKPVVTTPKAIPSTSPSLKPAPDVVAAPLELPKLELPGGMNIEDLKKQLSGSFNGITETLGTITDVDTAKGAVSKLQDAARAYADLGMDKMPASATGTLAPFVKPYFEKVGGLLNTLYLIPGVKDIIEPVLGPMVQSVSKMMG